MSKRRRSTGPPERKLFAGGQFPIDTPVFHPDQTRIADKPTCPKCGSSNVRVLQHTDGTPAIYCKECIHLA